MPPDLIPFHAFAQTHVDTAKALAQEGPALRYACLELRLAIEALAYATLQTYAEDESELVVSAQADWQPSKVLEKLLDYDPMADMALRVVMGTVEPDGTAGAVVMDEVDRRFTAAWAGKAHRSMGSFLHQRTIREVRRGKQIDEAVLRGEALRVLATLEAILASPLHDVRVGFRFGYDCPGCGEGLSVALLPLMMTGVTRTRCPACGAGWRAEEGGENGTPRFTPLKD